MAIVFTQGDLFTTPGLQAYAQGCDCTGNMDVGVGVAFKKRWPSMADEFSALCAAKRFHLGDVFAWIDEDTTIYNLGLQENWKSRAKLAALSKAVRHMVQMAAQSGIRRIGLPRIGAGLGGLDWRRVKSILSEIGQETTVELLVFERFVRSREK